MGLKQSTATGGRFTLQRDYGDAPDESVDPSFRFPTKKPGRRQPCAAGVTTSRKNLSSAAP